MKQVGAGSSSPGAFSQPEELCSEPAFSWPHGVKWFRAWRLEPGFPSGLMLPALWPWAGHFT